MKKEYEKPEVEFVDFLINDYLMNADITTSDEVIDDPDEGITM